MILFIAGCAYGYPIHLCKHGKLIFRKQRLLVIKVKIYVLGIIANHEEHSNFFKVFFRNSRGKYPCDDFFCLFISMMNISFQTFRPVDIRFEKGHWKRP